MTTALTLTPTVIHVPNDLKKKTCARLIVRELRPFGGYGGVYIIFSSSIELRDPLTYRCRPLPPPRASVLSFQQLIGRYDGATGPWDEAQGYI